MCVGSVGAWLNFGKLRHTCPNDCDVVVFDLGYKNVLLSSTSEWRLMFTLRMNIMGNLLFLAIVHVRGRATIWLPLLALLAVSCGVMSHDIAVA